ncbi:MAG: radical SAM protein [Thermofilum sp.]
MPRYLRVKVSRALTRSGLYDLDYAYNPYGGCVHACLYCYARYYTPYREVAEKWGEVVYIKENIVEVLSREVRRLRPGVVGVSTTTDPYQPVEAEETLTRKGLEVLLSAGFRVSIQTKSPLVTRDLDLLAPYRGRVDVGFTITTLDDEAASAIEPRAPPPSSRAKALADVAGAGLETWVFLGPILRGVNDSEESIREVAELALETGSKLYYDYLHLKPGLEKHLAPVLAEYPRAASTPPSWRRAVEERVERICREIGLTCEPAFPRRKASAKLTDFYFQQSNT